MKTERSNPETEGDFVFFKSYSDYLTSKNILYEKLENKINLFETCLKEVGISFLYEYKNIFFLFNNTQFRLI
jgi:hypothetical protein